MKIKMIGSISLILILTINLGVFQRMVETKIKITFQPKFFVGLKVITNRPAIASSAPKTSKSLNFSFKKARPKKTMYKTPIKVTKSVLTGPIFLTE